MVVLYAVIVVVAAVHYRRGRRERGGRLPGVAASAS
jgi:hypothetical protein